MSNLTFSKLQRRFMLIFNRVLLLNIQIYSNQRSSNQKRSCCLGGRHYSNSIILIGYEKANPKTNKIVETRKGNCDNYRRAKRQIFTK